MSLPLPKNGHCTVGPSDWMSELKDDNVYISELTIPGTHDSHATSDNVMLDIGDNHHPRRWRRLGGKIPAIMAATQKFDIRHQLESGIRFLDLRCGKDWQMRHGVIRLQGTLRDVLQVVADFLERHSRETVLISVKWDHESIFGARPPEPVTFESDLLEYIASIGSWYTNRTLPTLGQCRGSMVLLRRFDDHGDPNNGIFFNPAQTSNESDASVPWQAQDQSEPSSIQAKWDSVRDMFERAKCASKFDQILYFNFLSAARMWKPILFPSTVAAQMNLYASKYLASFEKCGPLRLGIIILDFPESGNLVPDSRRSTLVQQLIQTNFDNYLLDTHESEQPMNVRVENV